MPATSYSSFSEPTPFRRRAAGFLLALIANGLLLLMLLRLAPDLPFLTKPVTRLITIPLPPEPRAGRVQEKVAKAKLTSGGASPKTRAAVPTPPKPLPPLPMLVLSHNDFAAADISRIAPAERNPGGGPGGAGEGTDAGDDNGPKGPGGERLYRADWYRKPTDAELAFYLPKSGPPTGWGEIACRTVADYRVEDCVELGQSPPGSGFSRAVRESAWQFRVRPPRIGDKSQVGGWVRIRIDYTERVGTLDR